MEVGERKCSSGYGKPPWSFRGRAFYQLHLVKTEVARACIPKEFKLIEAFGYTLGGFFLASYDDSPAGKFDELVVIAGLVPDRDQEGERSKSCAWAAKVLVNSDEACDHGRKEVGLPSQVARFSKRIREIPKNQKSKNGSVNLIRPNDQVEIQVTEVDGTFEADICKIDFTTSIPFSQWMGPMIKLSLPSFSGHTEYTPHILKYSCQIECRVRAVRPAKVTAVFPKQKNDEEPTASAKVIDDEQKLSRSVLLSKPILALEFSCMNMKVEAPVVSHCLKAL